MWGIIIGERWQFHSGLLRYVAEQVRASLGLAIASNVSYSKNNFEKKYRGLSEAVGNHRAGAFFILTVAISLAAMLAIYTARLDMYGSLKGILLYLAYMLSPAIAAVLLLAVFEGREGVLGLFGSLLRWRVSAYWYLMAIFFPVVVELLATEGFVAIYGKLPAGYGLSLLPWNIMLYMVISSVGLVLGLGYVLPLLLKTYSPAITSAITALFIIAYRSVVLVNDRNAIVTCIGLFALAFVLFWMYNNARNSLLILSIFLFVYTLVPNLFTYRLAALAGTALPIYASKALFIVVMAAVILLHGHYSED